MLRTYLSVMAAGAVGTGVRMFLAAWIADRAQSAIPWGTIAVNVTGCFVIGVFGGLAAPGGALSASLLVRQTIMIGFLGGFTTFSSFSIQTLQLALEGQMRYALLNVALSLASCLTATWAGLSLISLSHPR